MPGQTTIKRNPNTPPKQLIAMGLQDDLKWQGSVNDVRQGIHKDTRRLQDAR